jgi:hypothetical protein
VPSPGDPVTLVGVYRARNARLVRELNGPALARGWTVAWWALDEVVDDLAELTVGSGPGEKLPLLNEIQRRIEPPQGWLVVTDDDVTFDRGDVVRLVSLCRRLGLDLAQPARSDRGGGHEITFARRLSVARRTTFVEIGPVFAIGPRWRDRIVPFPEELGMGWGVELDWLDLHKEGCLLGIVDAVRVRHEGPLAEDYDGEWYLRRLRDDLNARGIEHWPDVQETLETVRPWRRRRNWSSEAGRAG